MRFVLFLCLFVTSSLWAKPACKLTHKKIVVANKTDLKEEIEKKRRSGWKPEGKAVFKDWGYHQSFKKKICK